jgi:signal transduction histidine kinase
VKRSRRVVQHFVGGEEHYFQPQAIPILDSDRQPTGVVLVLQDVTQEREQEEMKGGIIATVSHQLKTPLTSIRMAIHLLLEEKVGALTPKQTELLLAAREESERLCGILNNLLDMNRIESDRAALDFRRVPTPSLVAEALEPLEADFRDKGVSLASQVQYDLPDVWADVTRVNHVFANLLSNALRYTLPGGKVTVRATADEQWVRFSVSDTGSGIPAEHLSHVFEPFFRVPDQEAGTGTGLGLSIAKEIVEAHGGSITAGSRPGEGSTFAFTLKRADRVGEGSDTT